MLLLARCASPAPRLDLPPAGGQPRCAAASGVAPPASPAASGARASSGSPERTPRPAASGAAGHRAAPPPSPALALQIEAFDLRFKPKDLTVEAAGTYTIEFKNTGAIAHDITPDGGETHTAQAGETVIFDVVVPDGGLPFICSVPGHAAAGMTGTISVAGSTAGRRRQPWRPGA